MTADARPLVAGRVGRAHGLDGSFHVEHADHPLPVGTDVRIGQLAATIERRAGSDARPLVRVNGVRDREGAQALRGQTMLVLGAREPLGAEEWYDDDLVGCRIAGLGEVKAVVHGPSCDLLEVGDDDLLIPLVRDAVTRVDVTAREIDVDRRFLGLEGGD